MRMSGCTSIKYRQKGADRSLVIQNSLTSHNVAGISPFLNLKAQIADKRVSTRNMDWGRPKAAEAVYIDSVPASEAST